jgi:hypothetical protein
MSVTLNASTSSGLVQTADTSGTIELQSNGSTKLSVLSTGVSGVITSGTAVASTSGTSIDFTGIPSWVKRVTVVFTGVSTNGTSNLRIQIGGGSVETSGYAGSTLGSATTSVANSSFTGGFDFNDGASAASIRSGSLTILNINSNLWVATGILGQTDQARTSFTSGNKTTAATLDRVRITTVNGTDTFDAGTINIQYEG